MKAANHSAAKDPPAAGRGALQPGSASDAQPPTRERSPAWVDPAILDLIGRPYLAEILTAVDDGPHTIADLRHHTGAPRKATVAALRALAVHQAITRHPVTGTWDADADKHVRYQLSTAGRALIQHLWNLILWAALYQ